MLVNVLGTAQDAGIPHPNCHCRTCSLARRDSKYRRAAASLSLHFEETDSWYLIDPTPDFKEQLDMVQQDSASTKLMDGIFLTHAHIGHYTGLMFLGKEAIATNQLPVMAGRAMKAFLEIHYPWKQLVDFKNIELKELKEEEPFILPEGVSVVPLEVPHRNEFSETFGFFIKGIHKTMLYIPDIDGWEMWQTNLDDLMQEVDYCLIDGTFYSEAELAAIGRRYQEVPHPLITHSMKTFAPYKENTEIYFTHFNHSNPVISEDTTCREKLEAEGFHVLEEGMEFEL